MFSHGTAFIYIPITLKVQKAKTETEALCPITDGWSRWEEEEKGREAEAPEGC